MEPTIEQEDDTEISVADLAQQNGFTVDQLVTLASMVQAEGANEDDMRSSLIYSATAWIPI